MRASNKEVLNNLTALPECPSPILIIAPDRVRRERAVKHIFNHFSKTPGNQLSRLNAKELQTNELDRLALNLASQSLFSTHQFFLIDGIENLASSQTAKLTELLKSQLNSVVFLLSQKLPASHALYKLAQKKESLLLIEELKGFELVRWVEREFKRHGITKIDDSVPQLLISFCDSSPDALVQVIEQLSLYVDSAQVTRTDALALFQQHLDANEFSCIDAITANKRLESELQWHSLIATHKVAFPFLSLLHRNWTSFLTMKAKGSIVDANIPKGRAWYLEKQMKSAGRYNVPELIKDLRAILTADSKLKNRSLGPELIVSSLLKELAPSANNKS